MTFLPLGGGAPMTWARSLAANYTDGIVVLHRGRIVYERYFGCLDEAGKHGAMSMTKSLTGLLAEILVQEGRLDEGAMVSEIVPELAGSAFGNATVRQVMDMTTGVRFSEDYADLDSPQEPFFGAVSGHPALSEGVVVHNGGWGLISFGVPPRNQYLYVFVNPEQEESWEESKLFAVADDLLGALGWLDDSDPSAAR